MLLRALRASHYALALLVISTSQLRIPDAFFQRVSSAIRIRGRLFVSITEDLPNRRWLSAISDQLGRSVVSAKGKYWPRVFELSIS